jgi:hypothetical protein
MKRMILILVLFVIAFPNGSSAIAQKAPLPPPPIRPVPVQFVEQHCPTVIVYQRGTADSFLNGPDPVYPSLALDAFLQSTAIPGFPPVAYDENSGCDHAFGDSFKLDACVFCCGICSATLEITLRGCGSSLDCNDSITVGQAPFGVGGVGYVLWNGYVDPNGCPNNPPIDTNGPPPTELRRTTDNARRVGGFPSPTIVKTISLDPRKVAELICQRKISTLDVYIQDDQSVDSMRLIITKP